MNVKELIEFLQTQPQDLTVAYECHSEFCLLDSVDVTVEVAGIPRPDGWLPRKRPDQPTQSYLVFPGN